MKYLWAAPLDFLDFIIIIMIKEFSGFSPIQFFFLLFFPLPNMYPSTFFDLSSLSISLLSTIHRISNISPCVGIAFFLFTLKLLINLTKIKGNLPKTVEIHRNEQITLMRNIDMPLVHNTRDTHISHGAWYRCVCVCALRCSNSDE